MDFSSFLTSLMTSFIIFMVLMLLFTWLSRREGNQEVYYPNRILKGMDPYEGSRRHSRNPFAWISEAMSSSEADVINMSGVDSAVYFVFLSTVLGILFVSGLVLLPILLPIAYTDPGVKFDNTTSKGAFNELDRLSMGHVQENSLRLWAFIVATYWVSVVTYFLLWKAYKHVCKLRAAALMSPEVKAEQFAVLVRDLPLANKGETRTEQVDSYFQSIYPDTFYRSMVVTDNKKVDKIYVELEGYKKKLARAEAIYAESKKENPEGIRPTHKPGCLGIIGSQVDSIEYYNEKINETIPILASEQKITIREKQLPAALVFFTNRVTAASASQSLLSPFVDRWTVLDAPESCQLLRNNLHKGFYQRLIRQYIIYFIVFLTIFFYMIPIGLISAFTTLDNLRKLLPFLKPIVEQRAIKTVLEAYLPQVALIVFLALLPKFLLFLSKAEGIPSESHATRAASGKYFYFSVLNVFIGVTIGGTLFDSLKSIEKDPNSIITVLASSLPGNATFFLTFVALKFFIGYGLELSRVVPLLIFHLKRKYMCKTEAEIKEAWAPGDIGYATRVPNDLLIITIVLCYSVIAPVIIPFGVLYFGLGWLVLRNQVLNVYVPAYESNGRWWPHMYTRIIAALTLYQVTMLGYFGVKKFIYTAVIVPLPIISFIFVYICQKKFYRFFQSSALEVASRDLKELPNLERVYRSYLPPSLCDGKHEDEKFEKREDHRLDDELDQASRTISTV